MMLRSVQMEVVVLVAAVVLAVLTLRAWKVLRA